MDTKSQKEFFKKAYDLGDKRIEEGYGWPMEVDSQFKDFVKEIKKTLSSGRTLDVGCGQGRHAIYLAQNGFCAYGVDYIERAIKEAKQNAKEQGIENIEFEEMDVLKLNFPDSFFDIVVDWSVIDHIKPKDWFVYTSGISRVLRSGGYLILSEFSSNDKRVEDKFEKNFFEDETHYNHYFRMDEIESLFGGEFDILNTTETELDSNPKFVMLNILLKKK